MSSSKIRSNCRTSDKFCARLFTQIPQFSRFSRKKATRPWQDLVDGFREKILIWKKMHFSSSNGSPFFQSHFSSEYFWFCLFEKAQHEKLCRFFHVKVVLVALQVKNCSTIGRRFVASESQGNVLFTRGLGILWCLDCVRFNFYEPVLAAVLTCLSSTTPSHTPPPLTHTCTHAHRPSFEITSDLSTHSHTQS